MPGFIIAAMNSGAGKTTVSMAIMGALKKRGLKVQPFKVGPDYIDPMFHTYISGNASRNLDAYLLSEDVIKHLYANASEGKDISIVEGVMGLYDGVGGTSTKASTAYVARLLGLPVILVINGEGLSMSVVPMLKGFLDFDNKIKIRGVIFNNIKSASHFELLKKNVVEHTNVKVLGYMPKDDNIVLESRHLGLVPGMEVPKIRELSDKLSELALKTIDMETLLNTALTGNAERIRVSLEDITGGTSKNEKSLSYSTKPNIAVPYDSAFNFYYKDNLDLLEKMGAKILYFSPLKDKKLPDDTDGIYIGGGYPEVFAPELSQNVLMLNDIHEKALAGIPIFAECGGLMYLSDAIKNYGQEFPVVGALETTCEITDKLQNFGYVEIEMLKDTVLSQKGTRIKAHEFHYSRELNVNNDKYCIKVSKAYGSKQWLGGHAVHNVLAMYPHIHFWSNVSLARNFILKCAEYRGGKYIV